MTKHTYVFCPLATKTARELLKQTATTPMKGLDMKNATLGQIQKILNYLEKVPSNILQQAIEFGLVSDFCEADPKKINRAELRRALGLPSLAEKAATRKLRIPALSEKKTRECLKDTSKYKFYCRNEGVSTWDGHKGFDWHGDSVTRQGFDESLPEIQPASPEGIVFECPMSPHRGTLEFAQHIAGRRGSIEEVSELLIKNGNCFTLQEVEMILEMWKSDRYLLDITTRGIWLFVQNAQGAVSILHFEGGPNGNLSNGAIFVLRPLKDADHFQYFGHEQFLVKEPRK